MILFLLLVVTYASVTDCMTHRIPNWLCLCALIVGICLQITAPETVELLPLMASFVVPFLLFIPFYIAGGMAAGDVKLMTACGALLGWPTSLLATGYTLVFGMFLGVCVYMYRGGWTEFKIRYGTAAKMLYMTGQPFMSPADENSVARSRFPYAIAIAAGCVGSMGFPSS